MYDASLFAGMSFQVMLILYEYSVSFLDTKQPETE
jgi:hypothetical protein